MPCMQNHWDLCIPETDKEMFFDSELPPDFQQVLEKWRYYTGERSNEAVSKAP